jgi:hypothetical protein
MLRRHASTSATFAGIAIALSGCNLVFQESVPADAATDVVDAAKLANIVFISANTYNGNLGGVAGANAKCQMEAMQNQLEGEFVALIGNTTQNYIGGLGTASRGWTTRSGTIVADLPTDFLISEILHPMTELASGAPFSGFPLVWSGSYPSGEPGPNCDDWALTSGKGLVGDAETDQPGVNAETSCVESLHLLCAGKGRSVQIKPPPLAVTDKRIFVSNNQFANNSGRAEADAICRSEATAALLPQGASYLAILGDSSASALVRFSNDTYYRTDGVAIGPLATAPLSFLNRIATGKRSSGGGVVTSGWSATAADFFCKDWQSNSPDDLLILAFGEFAGERGRNYAKDSCNNVHTVYCALP